MKLFDEVQRLSLESHVKWFERYFKEYDLEHKIRVSAQKGYTGHLINAMSLKDEYLQRRLCDTKTIEMLRKRLGEGFSVGYQSTYSKSIFTGEEYLSDKKIHITW